MANQEELKMVTIRVHRSDIETLKKFYPTIGYNYAIRSVLRKFCHALETKYAQSGGKDTELAIDKELEINKGLEND